MPNVYISKKDWETLSRVFSDAIDAAERPDDFEDDCAKEYENLSDILSQRFERALDREEINQELRVMSREAKRQWSKRGKK